MTVEVEVEKVRTTPTEPELCIALDRASRDVLGEPLTRPAMGVLVAQVNIETGRLKSCFNFNIGNVRDLPGDGFNFVMLYTWELIAGKRWEGYGAFRAYDSLEVGVEHHIRFLTDFKRRPKYRDVWARVLAGDPSGTAHTMKAAGYYTAPVDDYDRALVSLAAEFNAKTSGVILPDADTDRAPPYVPQPLIVDPRAESPLQTVADVLDFAAMDDATIADLYASHVRGFHRPSTYETLPRLESTEAFVRASRAMAAAGFA